MFYFGGFRTLSYAIPYDFHILAISLPLCMTFKKKLMKRIIHSCEPLNRFLWPFPTTNVGETTPISLEVCVIELIKVL